MTTRERLAIIGCGALVHHHLLPSLRRIDWRPDVLIDPSSERREIIAHGLGRKHANVIKSESWETVRDEFDAAIVAVPHALHAPIGLGLLQAGKNVFMEKPLATTVADCEALVSRSEEAKLILAVGLLRRYLHVARWTKALVTSGLLGDIRSFHAREGFVYNWATSTDAMLRPELAGGGVLMDTGAHTLDLLDWWLGPLTATKYQDDSARGVEADCILECSGPACGTGRIELSRTRNLCNTVRIEGSRGSVEIHLQKNEVIAGSSDALAFRHDGFDAANLPSQLFVDLFDAELKDFRRSIASGEQFGVSGAQAVGAIRLIEQAYRIRQPLDYAWTDPAGLQTGEGADGEPARLPAGARILVTGATGFIGGRLVERLREQQVEVRCIIRNLAQATRLARLPVELIRADLTDKDAMDRAMEGCDYVFHCAYDPRSLRQNIAGTKALLAAAARHKVRRFVYVSTFSVYEPFPDGELNEQTRDGDRSWVYTRTKLDLEKMVLEACRTSEVPASIVQPTIVYGPFSKPWTNAPAEMLLSGRVVLPEPGDGLCNCVYIDDLVSGMLLAAIRNEAVGQRFIISGPEPVTWLMFFNEFARTLKAPEPELWPEVKITKANRGLIRDLKMILSNPKKIVQILVRWGPARSALQSGLESLPKPVFDRLMRAYYREGPVAIGAPKLPDPQLLALYRSKAIVDSGKARKLLGYEPVYDFAAGMTRTRPYLTWAYADARRNLARQELGSPNPHLRGTGGLASAG